jgi:hypothetical protein
VSRAERLGCKAIFVTVDTASSGKRTRGKAAWLPATGRKGAFFFDCRLHGMLDPDVKSKSDFSTVAYQRMPCCSSDTIGLGRLIKCNNRLQRVNEV